jgi:hypothetical protein
MTGPRSTPRECCLRSPQESRRAGRDGFCAGHAGLDPLIAVGDGVGDRSRLALIGTASCSSLEGTPRHHRLEPDHPRHRAPCLAWRDGQEGSHRCHQPTCRTLTRRRPRSRRHGEPARRRLSTAHLSTPLFHALPIKFRAAASSTTAAPSAQPTRRHASRTTISATPKSRCWLACTTNALGPRHPGLHPAPHPGPPAAKAQRHPRCPTTASGRGLFSAGRRG